MFAAVSKVLLSRSGRLAVICILLLALLAITNPSWGDEPAAPQGEDETAEPDTWKFTLGAGVGVGPAYEGSDELDINPVPLVMISWRDIVTLGPDRLAVHASGVGPVSASLSVGYNGGRDEDDSDDLEGLGDIGPAAQFGLDVAMELAEFGPFRAAAEAAVRQDIGGADGLTVAVGPNLSYQATPTLGFEVAASATWADSRHMEDYFGISAGQARASGRPEFDPDSGIKRVDLSLGVNWQAFESWTVMGKVGVGRLISDAADSPITESKTQASAFLGLGYSF